MRLMRISLTLALSLESNHQYLREDWTQLALTFNLCVCVFRLWLLSAVRGHGVSRVSLMNCTTTECWGSSTR